MQQATTVWPLKATGGCLVLGAGPAIALIWHSSTSVAVPGRLLKLNRAPASGSCSSGPG